ncbi:ABC transporter substrate-binding protein [Granulosicoccus sp.]|nr:ABC transporter substrate-binding protein [Granulosicoccus sp.]MDB4224194.1 ABC transporter substrate-binding protein [Granulosicoccus sp.]
MTCSYLKSRRAVICFGASLIAIFGLCLISNTAHSNKADLELDVNILYIEQRIDHPPVLSNLVSWPEDEGEQGAVLGINDNNTTGRFLGQKYILSSLVFEIDEPKETRNEHIREALSQGSLLVVANLDADDLLEIAKLPEARDDLIFNAQSAENELRQTRCQTNVLHTVPSRAMHTDALIQLFTKKKWRQIFLIEGNGDTDSALADSYRGSIKKFGMKIVKDKVWIENADMRRNASNEVPVFTQARKYDVVIVADEDRDFAQYIPYNTWLPRPVSGSAGLTPVTWSPVIEQWGAAQLQSRFGKQSLRDMTSRDYSNWAAVRAIGEAVTRTQSIDVKTIRTYLLSEDFELGGFKGSSLSFRQWNGQMRQPVQLVHARAVVASAPIEGFLHPVTELDTLGFDKAENRCKAFD